MKIKLERRLTVGEVAVGDTDGSESFGRHWFDHGVYHHILITLRKPQRLTHRTRHRTAPTLI